MKKCLLSAMLLLCFSFANAKEKIKVVTTFTIIQDIAQNVAGDAAEIVSITKPGAEIHDYQPTPKDIVKAQSADLIIWNGMNLERWFERFFQQLKNVPEVVATKGIKPLSIYEGPYSGKPNPHAWMSTENALVYIENIRQALVAHDGANADVYNANAKAYSEKVRQMRAEIDAAVQAIPKSQRVLVTSEGAFSYLAKDLGFEELYLWPINADQQGSPRQIKTLIDKVSARKIPVVFSESTISDKPAKQVAIESGALYGGVLFVDSLSEAGGKVPTYLDLLWVTTQTIVDGFKKATQQ